MAKKFNTTKQTKYSTKWLKNAMKSVGISTSEVVQEYAPNLSEIVKSGQSAATSIARNMKRNTRSSEQVARALQNNKYVKFAQSAYKNAISDLKSGNFNNEERMTNALLGDDGGFSFSDDGAEGELSLNVDTGMSAFGELYQQTSEANLKAQQASMNASIAVSAASMQQVGEIGGELISQLSNINNSLAAIVQFNNDNMTKLITASTTFFDRMGSAYEGKNKSNGNSRVSASDIMGPSGFNMNAYKRYVKEQFKDIPELSMMTTLLSEENLSMLASNPLGFASKAMVSYLMPGVVKGTIQSFEKSFNNAMPKLLMDLGDIADEYTGGLAGGIKGILAKTLGIKLERDNKLGGAKVNRDAIPFDGETKHAITSIITKELRDQTGYLEIIADKLTGPGSKTRARAKGEFWSWNSNKFVGANELDKEMAGTIVDAISRSFNSSTFGKGLNQIIDSSGLSSDKREKIKGGLNEVYVQLERITKSGQLNLSTALEIVNNSSLDKKSRKLVADYISKMASSDFNGLHSAVANANNAANKAKEELLSDPNYIHSKFYMTEDLDSLIDETMQYGAKNRGKNASFLGRRDMRLALANNRAYNAANNNGYNPFGSNGYFAQIGRSRLNAARNLGSTVINGGGVAGVAEVLATSLIDQIKITGSTLKDTMFGSKNSDGKFEGGAFSDLLNSSVSSVKGVFNKLNTSIFGEDGIEGFKENGGFKLENILSDENKKWFEDHKISLTKQGKGAFAGGLIGSLIGGPILGTVIGSATGMIASSEKFHEFLFGSKETETVNGKEYKKKVGLVEQVGNYVNAYLLKPIKDEAKYVGKSLLNSITGQIINPIKIAFEPVTTFLMDTGKAALKKIGDTILGVGKAGGSLLGFLFPKAAGMLTKMGIFKADFGVRLGQGLLNIPNLGLEMFARLTGNTQMLESLKNNRTNFLNKQKSIKAARKEDRRHTKNAQLISKLTNGRFSEDTEEARMYVKHLDELAGTNNYEKYFGTNANARGVKSGKIGGAAIDAGRSTQHMNEQQAANADISGMNPESQQVSLLAYMKGSLNHLVKEFTEFAEHQSNNANGLINVEDANTSNDNSFEDALEDFVDNLPHHKKGGKVKKDGPIVVGEAGPEIINAKKGDDVTSSAEIAATLAENGTDSNRKSKKSRILSILASATGAKSIALRRELSGIAADELNDIRDDSLAATMSKVKTAAQLKEEKERQAYQKTIKDKLEDIKTGIHNTTDTIKDKFDNSIFSKKGVIGGLLIAFALKYPHLVGDALNTVVNLGSTVLGIAAKLGVNIANDAANQAKFTNENAARTNGNNALEEAQHIYDDATSLNILTDSNGNIKRQGTSVARYGAKMALDYAKAGTKGTFKGISKQARRRNAVFTGMKKAGGFAKNVAGKLTGKKAAETGASALSVMQDAQVPAKNKGLLKKCTDGITKFFDILFDKLPGVNKEKVLGTLGKLSPLNLIKSLKSKWDDIASKIATKISAVTGAHVSAGSVTLGLSEVGLIALSAIDGLTGTAKLFRVDKDKVDGKMRAIASAYGAFAGSTIGSIVDVVFAILGQVLGIDIPSAIATGIYKAWVGFDSEKANELVANQTAFEDEYKAYQADEISKAYEKALADGTIDPSVTLEQFTEGVKNGTYEAEYASFQDWNTQQNASLSDKVIGGVGKVVKGIGKGIKKAGSAVASGAKFVASGVAKGVKAYVGARVAIAKAGFNLAKKGFEALTNIGWYDTNGSYYVLKDNTWTKYNLNGDVIEENCDADLVVSLIESGKLKSHSIAVTKLANTVVSNVISTGKKLWDTASSKVEEIGSAFVDKVKATADKIKDFAKTGIATVKNAITKINDKFGWFDSDGSYFKYENEVWNRYNLHGDVIEENCDAKLVTALMASGRLKKAPIVLVKGAANTISSVRDKLSQSWEKAKEESGNAGIISTGYTFLKNGISSAANYLRGGSGNGDVLNGSTYFSQNDSRWKNSRYSMGYDSATMGSTGCGPTAMAMAASDALHGNVSPTSMAGLAQMTGNRDSTGTNWNFINQSSRALGLNSSQVLNPSSRTLSGQIASGNPVVLSGMSTGSSSPFTKDGHYVVAVGQDGNGNVIINDPRGKQYSGKYNINEVARNTGSSWMISGGRGQVEGTTLNSYSPSSNTKPSWLSVVQAVKQAIANQKPGYSQSNWISIIVDKITKKIRTDCSGFVTACLKYFGVVDDRVNMSSANYTSKKDSTLIKTGFTPADWPGWENLLPGDIIARNGHVEIFAKNENNKHYVYNCGSDASVNNPGMTVTGHKDGYQTIWRPTGVGADMVLPVSGVNTDSTEVSTGATAQEKKNTDIFGTIGSAFSTLFQSAIGGLLGGKTKNTFADDLNEMNSSETESTDTSTSNTGVTTVDTSGDSNLPATTVNDPAGNAKRIWNYLKNLGYSDAAISAILGNLQAESGLNPAIIQGNGKGPAAGLAQWENYNKKSSRWKQLNDLATSRGKSWTDLDTQLEFLHSELSTLPSTYWKGTAPGMKNVGATATDYNTFKNTTDVAMATRQFEGAFERAGKPHIDNRIKYAKGFMEQYGGGSGYGIPMRGGFGAVSTNVPNTTAYGNTYSKPTSSTTSADMIRGIIKLLEAIANNTGTAANKLDLLKSLGSSVNIANVSSSTSSSNSHTPSADRELVTLSSTTAEKIARGY